MIYLLLTITPLLAVSDSAWLPIVLSLVGITVVAILLRTMPRHSKERADWSNPSKFPRILNILPRIRILNIQSTDSNWVVLHKLCGWVGIIVAIIAIFQEQYMTAVYLVCMGLSAFLAAHILRLLEKGVHHLENLDKRGEQQTKE